MSISYHSAHVSVFVLLVSVFASSRHHSAPVSVFVFDRVCCQHCRRCPLRNRYRCCLCDRHPFQPWYRRWIVGRWCRDEGRGQDAGVHDWNGCSDVDGAVYRRERTAGCSLYVASGRVLGDALIRPPHGFQFDHYRAVCVLLPLVWSEYFRGSRGSVHVHSAMAHSR